MIALLIALPAYSRAPSRSGSFQDLDGVFGRNFPSALFASEGEVVGQVHQVVALRAGDMLIDNHAGHAPDLCGPGRPFQPGSVPASRSCRTVDHLEPNNWVFFLGASLPAPGPPNCDIQHKNAASLALLREKPLLYSRIKWL